jgi:L-threonylcarbamoyladenylate synthase
MIILDYDPKKHKQIIHACVLALKQGKTVVYPTDTSYGLACDMSQPKAVTRLLKIKGRAADQLISVVAPSVDYARKMGVWNKAARKLSKKFWPGPLTIIIPLSHRRGTIGIRYPKDKIAHDLAYSLGRPISATSANRVGQKDCYSLSDILKNFQNQKDKPDIIINTGRLPKRKPSTLVKINGNTATILRSGPITKKQIQNVLK